MLILQAAGVYAIIGLGVGIAFVLFGVTRVLPHAPAVSAGARLLLVPGASVLWPYILIRWLRASR